MKHRAIFTSVKKDKYLPLWFKYYSQYFDDIYVIDNEPDIVDPFIEEAKKKYKFTKIDDYPNPANDLTPWNQVIREFQVELLKKYKWVLYADADEFVVPDPDKYKDLSDYIQKCTRDYVHCTGFNVLHMYEEERAANGDILEFNEPALDLEKPILAQRKYWWYEYGYNKPLLARIPLNWENGMHNLIGQEESHLHELHDPDLFLIHLKQADWDIFRTRIGGSYSADKGPEWFYKGRKQENEKELIPERLKSIL